jgi:2-polyprenyl-3-methyl-5-hydroxy-6-metoxy-1,4-benzoquinol methylase
MKNTEQKELAAEMLTFLKSTPLSADLEWTKDKDFLFHFESARQMIVRKLLSAAGLTAESAVKILDVGYLHGLTQEFTHRAFPRAQITVFDLPSSPIFSDLAYLRAIETRGYLTLKPKNADELSRSDGVFDVFILGEVIEHMDPTQVARLVSNLAKMASENAVLIITTPNAAGLYNCYMTFRQKDAIQVPPIPNPTHGYGHIHVWSPPILARTAEHFGWSFKRAEFYHGREGEMFDRLDKKWGSLSAQINMRLIKILADFKPSWRGFFVAVFIANNSGANSTSTTP